MIRVFESASGRERLAAAAEYVRSFPPSTELLIVGATREAVDDFVRQVSRETGATFGLHRFSFAQLVSHLATAELAALGLAPATRLSTEAVCSRATFEALERKLTPRLAPVSGYPGFARALAATLSDLRVAGIHAAGLGNGGDGPDDLAALLELFEEGLQAARIADRATLLQLAVAGLDRGPVSALRTAPVLLADLEIRASLERDLLARLLQRSPAVFATVPAGEHRTLDAIRELGQVEVESREADVTTSLSRLQRYLFSERKPPRAERDDGVQLFSAPGEGRECAEIARAILAEARRGVPFDEIAVFVRAPEVYSAHLETMFRRAGVPAFFARGTRRPDPAGRAFLALLACKVERLSAKRFAEYLSFGQVPTPEEGGAPPADREMWVPPEEESLRPGATAIQLSFSFAPSDELDEPPVPDSDESPELAGSLRAPWRWEEYLVEASVIGGHERWRRRLSGLKRELRLKVDEIRGEEPESPRLPGLERDLTNLGHFERFALPVIEILDGFPRRAHWGEWLQLLSGLAPMVLRRPERVLGVLAEMQPMGAVGPVTIEEVRAVLGERLSTLEREQPPHRFGRVFVATPEQARARSFRVVFVPGLAERVFPQRPREDPLLLDAVRARLSAELHTQEDRGHDERMLLRLAVGAAVERVFLSYPRVDVVEARPRVPSFYGLDVARATRGFLPDHEELEREAARLVNARLAWPSPQSPDQAIDAVEHDLAVLGSLLHHENPAEVKGRARYLLESNEHLGRSLRARWVRWRARVWSPEDGLVRETEDTRDALERERPNRRPYSVTALQKFAACPYRFLLSAIHRLEPREEAVAPVRLDPLTRGSMIHEIQAQTLRALQSRGELPLRTTGREDAIAELDATLNRVAARYFEELAPAILRVWQDEVEAIRGDLRVWLAQMTDTEWIPQHFEFTFGLPPDPSYDPASLAAPVTLPGGWMLRGAVDLIERSGRENALRVTDHKTGANRTTEGWIVGGGETLQPVLYSLAVEAATGSPVSEARLSFCTSRGGFTERVVVMNDWARLYGRRTLEIIDRSVASGRLPPAPREGACTHCDFRLVCGPHEEIRAKRKSREILEDLETLRDLP